MEREFALHLEGRVEDVMSSNPVIIARDEGLDRLLELFKAYRFHGFPVVDGEGALVGIVRDTDFISMFARKDPASPTYRTVEDIMFAPPLTISPKATIQAAIMKMFSDQTRFLVVVDEAGKVMGVATSIDLIKGIHIRA